ncbi:MAG: phosphoribosylaminoimidazolesuccinocarboxamide synthase [Chloroflexi bacterium]|nr:phosphoribosylaminoimidazolesuccinocarboxamide synthase [Chloroflexota bacterium]MCY3938471.1 phosphoribosylaminoimidazolesuccinocarboxamide synthase [Chloroflexota bacterium]
MATITQTELSELRLLSRGKVRDIYDHAGNLLIVTTDRISAFDVVLPTPIPDKGRVLTQLSAFWFGITESVVENHLITTDVGDMGLPADVDLDELEGRSMLVKKAQPLPVECVARGYIIGSGWVDYQATGEVCGIKLPSGLRQADRLEETIFTPATKAQTGHDENIDFDRAAGILGRDVSERVRDLTLELYAIGHDHARSRGIILADTKYEFGIVDGRIVLIDEVMTPDSSRFWDIETYQVGTSPPSYDKQFVRDYLIDLGWNKEPPPPDLPDYVVSNTSRKYLDALERLTSSE